MENNKRQEVSSRRRHPVNRIRGSGSRRRCRRLYVPMRDRLWHNSQTEVDELRGKMIRTMENVPWYVIQRNKFSDKTEQKRACPMWPSVGIMDCFLSEQHPYKRRKSIQSTTEYIGKCAYRSELVPSSCQSHFRSLCSVAVLTKQKVQGYHQGNDFEYQAWHLLGLQLLRLRESSPYGLDTWCARRARDNKLGTNVLGAMDRAILVPVMLDVPGVIQLWVQLPVGWWHGIETMQLEQLLGELLAQRIPVLLMVECRI